MQNEMTNKCQFLIGNVRPELLNEIEEYLTSCECQFLIGNVDGVKFFL